LADSMTARANNPGSIQMPDIRLQAFRFAINIETSCLQGGVHIRGVRPRCFIVA
jgi:hypothetical protein